MNFFYGKHNKIFSYRQKEVISHKNCISVQNLQFIMAQVIKADLDEIVFEDREKRYGGYVLRKNYQKYLGFAFLIVLSLTALGVIGPYIYSKIQALVEANKPKEVEVDLSNLPPPPPEEKKPDDAPPPPPPPPKQEEPPAPPPPVEQVAVKTPVPKPPDEVKVEETIHEVQELDKGIVSTKDEAGEKPTSENAPIPTNTEPKGTGDGPAVISEPPPPPPPPKKEEPKKEEEPDPTKFVPGAKQPKEVNLGDIQKLIGYPAVAREMNLEGNIVFRVLVDENGNYLKHLPPKTGHPILIKAVEEHIGKVKFTPAIQGDKPIKFWVNVPFVFKLQ